MTIPLCPNRMGALWIQVRLKFHLQIRGLIALERWLCLMSPVRDLRISLQDIAKWMGIAPHYS